MTDDKLLARIGEKGADLEGIVERLIGQPSLIPKLIAGLGASQARARFGCEKTLRRISEKKPMLVYPYFDAFADLLEGQNSILKWGAIMTIANLAGVDSKGKIAELLPRYFALIGGPAMVTAANAIGSLPRIASARPELAERIATEILKVEKANYELHGCPSPECRNVAIGYAVTALGQIAGLLKKKKQVLDFVSRQLENPRAAVRKKAAAFLKKAGQPV